MRINVINRIKPAVNGIPVRRKRNKYISSAILHKFR